MVFQTLGLVDSFDNDLGLCFVSLCIQFSMGLFRSFSLNALDIFKYSMDESGCAFLRFLTMHLCFGLEKYSFFRYGMCLSKEPVG